MWNYKQNVIVSLSKYKYVPIRNMRKTIIDRVKLEEELNVKIPTDWYNVSPTVITTNLQCLLNYF